VKAADLDRAEARFRALLAQLPPTPDGDQVRRIAALNAAIRQRQARDRARNSGPAGESPTPLSRPDHEASNVSQSEGNERENEREHGGSGLEWRRPGRVAG
jgi:hypothetical protein